MGAARKLQAEIDKTLKKVVEGVEVFDSIWNKVYESDNPQQREKYETDLKKEIKKLQKHRDQIKTWLASNEIKDKKQLLDARKVIEREMERFKVCEKETKTKAFSKEGLAAAARLDPKDKAKNEATEWLSNTVDLLNEQVEQFEGEMEGITPAKKGKAKPPRLVHLEESISRHQEHIAKLETVLRLIENDSLPPDIVEDIKDLVEDYVERNQDDPQDFENVEDLYEGINDRMEELDADERERSVAAGSLKETHASSSKSKGDDDDEAKPEEKKLSKKDERAAKKEKEKEAAEKAAAAVAAARAALPGAKQAAKTVASAAPAPTPARTAAAPTPSAPTPLPSAPAPAAPPPKPFAAAAAGPTAAATAASAGPAPTVATPPPAQGQWAQRGVAPGTAAVAAAAVAGRPPVAPGMMPQPQGQQPQVAQQVQQTGGMMMPRQQPGSPPMRAMPHPQGSPQFGPRAGSGGPSPSASPQLGPQASGNIPMLDLTAASELARALSAAGEEAPLPLPSTQAATPPPTAPGAAPNSNEDLNAVVSAAAAQEGATLRTLDISHRGLPAVGDSEWPPKASSCPRRPVASLPAGYPTTPPPAVSSPLLFEKAELDLLFFAYYFQPGSRQQYLAARALKAQAWRWHKSFGAWFLRHEEGHRRIDEGRERGNYAFFDPRAPPLDAATGQASRDATSGWCMRVRQDMVFEYAQLEDELSSLSADTGGQASVGAD
ncbi:CCR4-NOT transcription complex subunit [Pycnococcus provasolii]|uniref:CCR4-NOT transcription complex subunit 3 n=1 Tax=Pycnococcus provasolii TaxID=41880 RepID=A0A7S3DZ47_9CHLO|mmetsp:Transcript_1380/g.3298  ORF Transcript_1380/g.3298 Transcript_1380/m.3298 type:complete len:719 (+) Transcript_1380:220-2376(+)